MATATDMVWVELSRERTRRGEITFAIAGKPSESHGLVTPADPHWQQAVQALEMAPLPQPAADRRGPGPSPVITLLPREAVGRYQAAFRTAVGTGGD